MKQIIFLIAAILMPVYALAQEGLVGVLYHGDDFKIYYSNEALKNAMEDAEDGDIITLSPGLFAGTTIDKAVTIRGAGIGAVGSVDNGTSNPTIISGSHKINISGDSESGHTLNIEGVIFEQELRISNLSNAIIAKSRFLGAVLSDSKPTIDNVSFVQCVFDNRIDLYTNNTISIYNSVLARLFTPNNFYVNCYNSVLLHPDSNATGFDRQEFTYHNCIFVSEYSGAIINYSKAFNCLFIGKHSSKGAFSGTNTSIERQNITVPDGEEIFVSGSFYELNENGKKYLGDDGTEVGIYGSKMPFSTVTSYPQIKKFNVSPESTTDGKLKIEFEIQ